MTCFTRCGGRRSIERERRYLLALKHYSQPTSDTSPSAFNQLIGEGRLTEWCYVQPSSLDHHRQKFELKEAKGGPPSTISSAAKALHISKPTRHVPRIKSISRLLDTRISIYGMGSPFPARARVHRTSSPYPLISLPFLTI